MQSASARSRCKKGAEELELTPEEMIKAQDVGVSRGGKNTKIHAVVDGLGNPLKLIFTGGEIHDSKMGVPLLEEFDLQGRYILGDKAYGTTELLTYIRSSGGLVVIPPKSNAVNPWECDYHHYKERSVVECFFNKLKHFRRVATRYDKRSSMFQAFAYIACIMIWLL